MLKLYSNQGSGNCYKVRLLLTQLDVPFSVIEMDVLAGDQRKPEYVKKNVSAKVPLVEFPDGDYLAESGAILYFFAQETPLWPAERRLQAEVLRWMFFEQNLHEPTIAVARFWCHYLNAEDEYAEALVDKRKAGYRALDVMERQLEENDFFAAGRYTIADIALYAYTHVAHEGGFSLERYPATRAWLDRVASQPKHVPITHLFPTSLET